MRGKITAQDELKVLNILHLAASGMTFDEVAQKANLDDPKLSAILGALAHKKHIHQSDLKYFLQNPFEDFKEPEEQ
ncbi:MAG: hypothetical protein ACYDH3_06345 [Candidatus Aminicenantales bacterium]